MSHELAGAGRAGALGQPLTPPPNGVRPTTRSTRPNCAPLGGEDHVAGERGLEGGGEAEALRRGRRSGTRASRSRRARGRRPGRPLALPRARRRACEDLADVDAAGEDLALGARETNARASEAVTSSRAARIALEGALPEEVQRRVVEDQRRRRRRRVSGRIGSSSRDLESSSSAPPLGSVAAMRAISSMSPPRGSTGASAGRPRSVGSRGCGSGRPSARRRAAGVDQVERRRARASSRIRSARPARRRAWPRSSGDRQQVVGVLARDHERVAARGGVDVHERDRVLVLSRAISAGRVAGDDRAEDAARDPGRAWRRRLAGTGCRRLQARRCESACSRVATSPANWAAASSRPPRRCAGPAEPGHGGDLVAVEQRRRRARRAPARGSRRASRGRARGGPRSPRSGTPAPRAESRSATVSRVTSSDSRPVSAQVVPDAPRRAAAARGS